MHSDLISGEKIAPRLDLGAQNQQDNRRPARLNKNPENEVVFGALKTGWSAHRPAVEPSSIQTVTVGPGISPGHAAWCTRLVGCTTDREFHPAPKVNI
jgi:hypothetical protein